MFTREGLESHLSSYPLVSPRVDTLRVAEEINPRFKDPHIAGGYLRNIVLGKQPNDCDVIFRGYMLNQPGITESVREAETRLGLEPYPEWEFENALATGFSKDFYEDNIGKYSHHTDYLTMLLLDTTGQLYMGEEPKALSDFEKRQYDLRFSGVAMWANHRGNGRSYASCLTGDLIRGLYLSTALDLTVSDRTEVLLCMFDEIMDGLTQADREARIAFWLKKTKGDPNYQPTLNKYGITTLPIISS